MGGFREDRRRLLRSSAIWVAGVAAVGLTRPAKALERQEYGPASPLALAVANHCGGASDHAALIAKLKAELAKNASAQSLSEVCPLCGCPVVVTR